MGDELQGDDEPVRASWHGMNQPKPRLPSYLRVKDRNEVTAPGVARDTIRWLVGFAIAAIITISAWRWLFGNATCAELIAGFKIGWC
jgi:hypothetical protein